jgi:hypothetical protein
MCAGLRHMWAASSAPAGNITPCPAYTQYNTKGGITNTQNQALTGRLQALKAYVNEQGGSLVVLTQEGLNTPYSFFPTPLTFVDEEFSDVTVTGNMKSISPDSDSANLDHYLWHGYFTGPNNYGGIFQVLVRADVSCPPYALPMPQAAVPRETTACGIRYHPWRSAGAQLNE